jgi:septin family protein
MDDDSNPLKIKPLKTNKSLIKINALMEEHVIPKHPSSVMFCGKSGSGKTMLLLNLLTNKSMAKEGGDDLYKEHCGENSGCHVKEDYIFQPNKAGLDQLDHIITTQKKIVKDKGLDKSPKIGAL